MEQFLCVRIVMRSVLELCRFWQYFDQRSNPNGLHTDLLLSNTRWIRVICRHPEIRVRSIFICLFCLQIISPKQILSTFSSTSTCLFIFGLNLMEIVAINLVPVIYRFVRFRLRKFDVKLILGTGIILFALISALTHKPHNIFLVGLQICTCRMANDSCRRLFSGHSMSAHIFAQCVAHYWIGKEFFFYQGNSNSLASIDLNAGYIGLQSFDFVSVGILLTMNTFSGPILSMLLFAYNIYQCQGDTPKKTPKSHQVEQRDAATSKNGCELNKALQIIPVLFGFPFTVYTICALAFRNHIFVWTVFSPKLLYEFYHLCLMVILWFLLYSIPHVE